MTNHSFLRWISLAYIFFGIGLWCILGKAHAATAAVTPVPAPPQFNAKGYLLVDYHTGTELAASNADERMEPASLTKLMTAYLAFTALQSDAIHLDDLVTISEKAWRAEGSRMFVEVGKQVSVRDLIQGMIVQSGNDATVALAEFIAGNEDSFVTQMNATAKRLGLNSTHYLNSAGMTEEGHYTTGRDIARLTRAIIEEFPKEYAWYSQKEFTYNGITQNNRNSLLWRDPSVDGVKTGHTESAGFCLVASAQHGDMRLISVVLGAPSNQGRVEGSQALLDYGFRYYQTYKLFPAAQQIAQAKVYKGKQQSVGLGLKKDLMITIPKGEYDSLSATMDVATNLQAPVTQDQSTGSVKIRIANQMLLEQPLYPLSDVQTGSFLRRAKDEIALWFE